MQGGRGRGRVERASERASEGEGEEEMARGREGERERDLEQHVTVSSYERVIIRPVDFELSYRVFVVRLPYICIL